MMVLSLHRDSIRDRARSGRASDGRVFRASMHLSVVKGPLMAITRERAAWRKFIYQLARRIRLVRTAVRPALLRLVKRFRDYITTPSSKRHCLHIVVIVSEMLRINNIARKQVSGVCGRSSGERRYCLSLRGLPVSWIVHDQIAREIIACISQR